MKLCTSSILFSLVAGAALGACTTQSPVSETGARLAAPVVTQEQEISHDSEAQRAIPEKKTPDESLAAIAPEKDWDSTHMDMAGGLPAKELIHQEEIVTSTTRTERMPKTPTKSGDMFRRERVIKPHHPIPYQAPVTVDRENYQHFEDNGIRLVAEAPVSTFSIDVDTGSYANVRRMLNQGQVPRGDAVRIEELINYFDYDYPTPRSRKQPFSVTTELAKTPWNKNSVLLQIGLKGYEQKLEQLPPANLVFLIDVSGSMNAQNKLPLLKQSLRLLVSRMREQDRISIVVYAGASGTVLEPTSGADKHKILSALENLQAGGSTNGASGIKLAYEVANAAFVKGGINRVLLCTDGDFNVGTVNFNALMDMVEQNRKSGVALSTFGFGQGNLNDHLAEQLADKGNGSYSYIDSLKEAQKVLGQQLSASLMTIAKDVKIQIEFNPSKVVSYRLIGYVNRKLAREDFNNDKVDAGDIGAGHTVTALYELELAGQSHTLIDALRYQPQAGLREEAELRELAFVKLRFKQPDADQSELITVPVMTESLSAEPSHRLMFSASVAAFGQKLRGGKYLQDFGWEDIAALARGGKGRDDNGHRGEFIQLISLAQALDVPSRHARVE
ncbi:MAG: VWA domain-containing protein [Gammaproteobacteria bacterium]|nr:VWA domain-containing protein [Gammaproteobacteria bacterium]